MTSRLYTIKEVSMHTGISTQLIRKWEERYEAVKPVRLPNGYRGYTKLDMEALLWLKRQVDVGVPIGMAVIDWKSGLGTSVLPSEAEGAEVHLERAQYQDYQVTTSADWNNPINQFVECFIALDLGNAQRLYEQLLAVHHLEYLMLHIFEPTLVELGERWVRGEISEYQEHFGSHFIRDKMLALRSLFRPKDDSPLLVTACGTGERHELGILLICFFAQQEDFRVVYLGSSPSKKGIYDCLVDVQPAAFTFSFSIAEHLKSAFSFFKELDRIITDKQIATKVYIGGRAVYQDGLLPGTKNVYLVAGDAKNCVEKIKTQILIS